MPSLTIIIIVVTALCFDFINGFHDCANAIATSVSTKVLTMRQAIIMSASLNFIGALMGVGVAKTIGSDMMNAKSVTLQIVLAALIAAIIWDLITWYYGLPSSSSHALIGGLIGAAILSNNLDLTVIHWTTFLNKIVLWLILSPVIGLIAGYIIMKLLNLIFRNSRPTTVSKIFSKAQIISAGAMAFMHGSNDAQKSMGVIAMALTAGTATTFSIPLWVILACASAMALGTSLGGAKIIKTVGSKMAKLAPVNGFAAETAGALVISFATYIAKAPVSTTHTITSAIMGVGASKRLNSVKWSVVNNIVIAWVLTIPVCAIIAGIIVSLFKLV